MQRNAYEVKFNNGVPVLSESVIDTLLRKGFREEQIKAAMESLSCELVKKALRKPDIIMVPLLKVQ